MCGWSVIEHQRCQRPCCDIMSLTTPDIWDAAEVQTLSSAAPFISEWPKGVNLTPYDTPAWAWGVKGTAGDQVDRCPAHDSAILLLVSRRMSGFIKKQSSEAVIWRCGRIWWVGMIKDKTRPFTFTAADSRFTGDARGDFFRLSYLKGPFDFTISDTGPASLGLSFSSTFHFKIQPAVCPSCTERAFESAQT